MTEPEPDPATDSEGPSHPPYVRSPVITTAARTTAPFVMTYGWYLILYGAHVPGGGFQGGVVVGATVVLLGLAFGLQPTREWLDDRIVTGGALVGFGLFGALSAGSLVAGGATMEVFVFPIPVTIVVEIVEVAIGLIVGGMVGGLFLVIGAGLREPIHEGGDRA
ncbi:multicomponent Na+:H+ antiporter subunit B [Halalkaliarchaeum desulfuricum]|uniref:Multicomponent Na+:H+ antiporter subunit B n=1 Tax=Halalkaliarchaeum desulfuricum TaxID=2055893 RepID=A0A343TIH5_9EURY|nr:MnhB domain-containing protein [Halalkaliarchaeum desulfuricum]AUX08897.1 multicomponent Na+:H+ antiporter subunit B [Halalkaliarchaeum desulfuricum]